MSSEKAKDLSDDEFFILLQYILCNAKETRLL